LDGVLIGPNWLFRRGFRHAERVDTNVGRHNRVIPHGEGTEFSQYVRRYRTDVRRLTQDQFLEELRLTGRYNKQYLSKVETGKVAVPHEDFLRAVEAVTRKPYDELRRMCGASEPPPAAPSLRPFDIVFGHDLRSAPLYLALTDPGTHLSPKFRAASQGFTDGGGSGWAPVWIGGNKADPAGRTPESYAAPDVVDALMERRIEVGGFPANVIENSAAWQDELMVLATIVNSIGPLNFVLNPRCSYAEKFVEMLKHFGPDRIDSIRALDTNTLGHIIKELADIQRKEPGHPPGFKIAVEKDTVAETALSDACQHAQHEGGRNIHEAAYGFPSKNALLLTHDFEGIARRGKAEATPSKGEKKAKDDWLLGVVTWQPHATVFARRLEEKLRPKGDLNFILNRSADATGRPRHMSYDLVVRRDALTHRNTHHRELRDALLELVTAVHAKAGYLNDNVGRHKLPGDAEERVAEYYGLGTADKAAEALETILFDVRLNVSSLEALRAL
jgi:transcriptional regulator with XRE-family HTH domain